ncbi:hypothetical protein Barb7_02498 [Bacteroidales bacterium Barb7]|nr:hypothetical protein Barb7_02498 [Bacteroidales bacterium Barb7]
MDKAFRSFADAVNLQFQANEASDKDDGIRQTLTQVIDSLNANIETFEHVLSRRGAGKTNSGGTGGGDTPQPEPEPTPTPELEPEPTPEPEPPTVLPIYTATATNLASRRIKLTAPDIPADSVPAGSRIDYTTLQEQVLSLAYSSRSDDVYIFLLPEGWNVSGQGTGAPQTVTLHSTDDVDLLEISNVVTRNIVQN